MKTNDGMANVVSGLGAANPKVAAGQYLVTADQVGMADAAFRSSTWYGKILSIPVDDTIKAWRAWQAEGPQIEALEAEEKRLGYRNKIREALMLARHQGGAVIVPGGLPGDPAEPLVFDRIGRGSITYLHVMGRDNISPGPIVRNPMLENYGQPEYWEVTGSATVRIHPSRVAFVNGRKVPGAISRGGEVWGDSIWLYMADAIMAADAGAAVIAALMQEAKIDVVTVPGLTDMLMTSDGEAAVIRRWTIAAQMKSLANVLILDGGPTQGDGKSETWEQKQINWTGIPEVQRTLLQVMAGAADVPVTRLTGEQQTGLSGSDAGSLRHYYDSLDARRELDVGQAITGLDEMLIRSALGSRPPEVWYQWRPLWQPTDKEQAEIDKLEADTAAIYANAALVPSEALEIAVQNRMVESGRWPGLDAALDDMPEDGAQEVPEPLEGEGPGGIGTGNEVQNDAAPRTLYVRRDVLNGEEIVKWAKAQGFETTLPADDMHVTIAFSRAPLDWMKISEPWQDKIELAEGGPRVMDKFSEANVLLFRSGELEWRHQSIRDAGASWDHAEYQPHITISYGLTPEKIEPYRGKIVLGPEIFEEVKDDWIKGIKEA